MTKATTVFGLTRGGSSITTRLLQILTSGAGWQLCDVGGKAYDSGIELNDISEHDFGVLPKEYALIGPFREIPLHAGPILTENHNIIIVLRDPRDCLVSHYHAFKKIHSVFQGGKITNHDTRGQVIEDSIDEYVLKLAPTFRDTLDRYLELAAEHSSTMVSKYEDIAHDPLSWIAEAIAFLKISPGASAINQAVIEAYFWRVGNDPFSHNRQGGSGEFVNELRSETITSLNDLFASQLAALNYEIVPQTAAQRYRALASNKVGLATALYSQRLQIDEMKRAIHVLLDSNAQLGDELRTLRETIQNT